MTNMKYHVFVREPNRDTCGYCWGHETDPCHHHQTEMSKPLELKSLEWFKLGDGRQCVTCKLLPEFPKRGEIPAEILTRDDIVHIDGHPWKVKGIEYFMSNPPQLGPALGMLVEKIVRTAG